ncbi:MAG: LysE family transporter [Saprospiraceae bacterium]|nr:LysE family transporter [Saprospiraceae bacterium]
MDVLIKGVLAGLAYALLLGPLFFMSLKITLGQGLRNGFSLIVGAFLSDFLLVSLSWWSALRLEAVVSQEAFQNAFGFTGAVLLFGFGLHAVFSNRKQKDGDSSMVKTKKRYAAMQGFTINILNPSNWLFWLSMATAARAGSDAPRLFLFSALATVFLSDITKVLLARRLGSSLTPRTIHYIVTGAGYLLMALSLWMAGSIFKV